MFLLLWKLYESGIRRDGSIKAILRAIITRVLLLYLLTVIICPYKELFLSHATSEL